MGEYPRIRVAGPPRRRGLAYGEQACDRIRRSLTGYQRAFEHYAGWDWPKVRQEAKRFEAPIAELYPAYIEELLGIADGAGAEFEDVLAINVRTEVMYAARARDAESQRGRMIPECTSFAVLPHASASGHTLMGQNWDWLVHCFDTLVVLEVEQPDHPNFVTVVEAGLLAKAGLNSSGIGLATNALVTDQDRGDPGLPYHVMLRAIYDCDTLADALSTLQRGIRASSANYLVGHADGVALDIEAAPGDFTRLSLQGSSKGMLLHTNHFLSPPAGIVDFSLWAMPDSAVRLDRIRAAIDLAVPGLSTETFQAACADHADFPLAVCSHPDRREHLLDQRATVASIVMDLNDRRILLADGNPCTAPYRTLDYGDFLSNDSRAAADRTGVGRPPQG